MKILLLYPEYPDTFWGFKHALKFIGKKAAFPPLGPLTVAAMLPNEWQKKLVDMNVESLSDEDIKWADLVFISAMIVQKKFLAINIINQCRHPFVILNNLCLNAQSHKLFHIILLVFLIL